MSKSETLRKEAETIENFIKKQNTVLSIKI